MLSSRFGAVVATCSSIVIFNACGPESDSPRVGAVSSAASPATTPTLTFSASWTQTASGPLVAGQPIAIAYDPSRVVSSCGGEATSPGGNGGFAWGITGYYALGGAPAVSFPVTITSAWASGNAQITPGTSGELAIWFGCSNTSGQIGWDSNYGQNYDFSVLDSTTDAGSTVDASAPTGTVVVQVFGDSLSGSAGNTPPDAIVSAPLADVLIYDGAWEAGHPLGETGADGTFTATLTQGVHAIGVMRLTTDDSMFSSDGNTVTVTSAPTTLAIHVLPDTLSLETSYDAGFGNAVYVTGETSALGNWQTAYKATYNDSNGQWQYTTHAAAGAQYKLIVAPWTGAATLPVSAPGVTWEQGPNHVAAASYFSVVELSPTF